MVKTNNHNSIFCLVTDFGIPGFTRREFVTRLVWKKLNEDVLLVAVESCDAPDFPERSGYVRATATSCLKFERQPLAHEIPQTRLTLTHQPDMKGFVPKRFVNGAFVGQLMYASR